MPVGPKKGSYDALNGKHIWPALKQTVLDNFGDTGWGAVGLSLTCAITGFIIHNRSHWLTVKYHSPVTNICIIRVARDHYRIAWGAITMLSSIEGQKYIPHVIHVSGE